MGDGEQDYGKVWEAVMWAGKIKLDNLTVIIDRNNIQIDGFTEDVMPLEPLREKYESFGWHVLKLMEITSGKFTTPFSKPGRFLKNQSVLLPTPFPAKE